MLTVRCDYETPYLKKENDHWSCWREAQGDGEMEQDLESRLGSDIYTGWRRWSRSGDSTLI